mmetsp:Transcript_88062/g.249581  ORF Transcript_88062/g.249581 Transcript_88062/m.249581 type:complete len:256 (-) Transcript_88062:491-1258(-)
MCKTETLVEGRASTGGALGHSLPPRVDANPARDMHEWFNLIYLVPVNVLNVMNWMVWDGLQSPSYSDGGPLRLWHGHYFEAFWWAACSYFVLDLLYVTLLPGAVRAPRLIMGHHYAALFGFCFVRWVIPDYQWLLGSCMLSEVNQYFLIARRICNRAGRAPFGAGVPLPASLALAFVSGGFYVTWFAIRVGVYPSVFCVLLLQYRAAVASTGTLFNAIAVPPVVQALFIGLNIKWTIDLIRSFAPKARGARSKRE